MNVTAYYPLTAVEFTNPRLQSGGHAQILSGFNPKNTRNLWVKTQICTLPTPD